MDEELVQATVNTGIVDLRTAANKAGGASLTDEELVDLFRHIVRRFGKEEFWVEFADSVDFAVA